MSLLSVGSFALAMLVLAASPGPGVCATLGRALASGLRPALALILGIILGDLLFLLFAIFGLSLLAEALGELFLLLKLVGSGYLLWLGLKLICGETSNVLSVDEIQLSPRFGDFFSGLLLTLGNPKVILFYCGFLPGFLDLSSLTGRDILIVATIVALVLFSVLSGYAWLASSARRLLERPGRVRWLNRVAGGILGYTGVMIAGQH